MSKFLYILAIILIIGWALGFFAFHASYLIHLLLLFALIVIILRVIRGKDPVG